VDQIDFNALISDYAIPWGIRLALAVVIFYAGRIVVALVMRVVDKLLTRNKLDETLVNFITSILRYVLLLFVVIAALSQLGIDTTSLIALLGAAGLAIGLALQGSLANFAAGVLLIMFRPFTKGDFIEAGGAMGTVTTPDNKEIIVPNGAIMGGNITNYSARPTRRVDMVFGISYGDDLREAQRILEEVIAEDERVLAEPSPLITVGELADSSVNFLVRPWVNGGDYWDVLWQTTAKVKLRFDEAGLTIPFPQRDLHVHQAPADPEV
jgi:small conductance mechanosensitive channel